MEKLLCLDSAPSLWGIFDPSIAPTLFYYSYTPIVIVAIFFGFFVWVKDKKTLRSNLLLAISIAFSLFIINETVQWIAVPAGLVLFGWELSALFQIALTLLTTLFLYVYVNGKYPSFSLQILLVATYLPVLVLLPTTLNITSFDLVGCEAAGYGPLWEYVYVLQIAFFISALLMLFRKYKQATTKEVSLQIKFLGVATFLFLGTFIATNILGDVTLIYELNLFGPLGMLAFLGVLAYMIVRFRLFNTRVFGAQMLVIALWILVFAMLFVRKIENVKYVIIATLCLVWVTGYALVKSVKKEIALRTDLQLANKNQQDTLRFITHEVKGYLTDGAAALDALVTGSFGPVTPDMKTMVTEALAKNRSGVREIQNFLRISDFKTGRVSYAMKPFDFKALLDEAIATPQENAKTKGLTFTVTVAPGTYTMVGDSDQILNHVVNNMVTNAVHYTPTGTVSITLEHAGQNIRLSVHDSGVGLTDDDKAVLFTEGGHGKDSRLVNPHSTGYGLYIAKQIVDAHHGRIWAESEGRGKGSTFIVEFPTNLKVVK